MRGTPFLYSGVVGPGLLGLLGIPVDPVYPLDPGTRGNLVPGWSLTLSP